MNIFNNLLKIFFLLILLSCTEKTYYSGKILNENIEINNFKNKNEIINALGQPSFVDPIEKKLYYLSEQIQRSNLLNEKLISRKLIVFNMNNEEILNYNEYNLDDSKFIKFKKETTQNNLINKGLIQKIFGGVSSTGLKNAPQN